MIFDKIWVSPFLAIAPVVLLLLVRRVTNTGGFALADVRSFRAPARRTSAVAGVTALVAALVIGLAAILVRDPVDSVSALLPSGESTVVVLDVSASVSDLVYDEIARTLALLADTPDDSVRVGLVLFSDVAQVALPAGTLPRELKPFVRFFVPKTEDSARARPSFYRPAGPFAPAPINYILSPWFTDFGGGTAISTGLAAAREVIQAGGGAGHVLLISDLDNRARDARALTRELVTYARSDVSLEVVAVPPAIPAQRKMFERIIAGDAVVDSGSLRREGGSLDARGPGLPITFILLTVGLALLIAAREPVASPVDLGRQAQAGSV
jgi:hypothetical protein